MKRMLAVMLVLIVASPAFAEWREVDAGKYEFAADDYDNVNLRYSTNKYFKDLEAWIDSDQGAIQLHIVSYAHSSVRISVYCFDSSGQYLTHFNTQALYEMGVPIEDQQIDTTLTYGLNKMYCDYTEYVRLAIHFQ